MKKKKHILTQNEKINLIKDCQETPLTKRELRNKYNISSSYFNTIFKEFNTKLEKRDIDRKRKYDYDTSCFKLINTEEIAYFLGILMADGCIRERKCNWAIELTMTDKDCVEKFKTFLKTNAPIKTQNKSTQEIKRKDSHTIYINSKEIVKDLAKFGVVNNKSYRTFIPEMETELIRHFIRGYFDADGCLYTRPNVKTNRSEPSITSASKLVLEQIEKHLKIKNIIRKERNYIKNNKKESYWTLIINNQIESLAFLDYIYSNCIFYMDRKFKKYKEVKTKPFLTKSSECSSKYFGVTYLKGAYKKVWHVKFYLNKKEIRIGNFNTEIEAALAYNTKIKELGLPDYMLNKIEEENPIISSENLTPL